jgi:hypothetical protein
MLGEGRGTRLLLGISLAMGLSIAALPAAQADCTTSTQTATFVDEVFNQCAEEFVTVYVVQVTTTTHCDNGQGTTVDAFTETSLYLYGVGQSTRNIYRGSHTGRDVIVAPPDCAGFTSTRAATTVLVGPAPGDDMVIRFREVQQGCESPPVVLIDEVNCS